MDIYGHIIACFMFSVWWFLGVEWKWMYDMCLDVPRIWHSTICPLIHNSTCFTNTGNNVENEDIYISVIT